jgi:hypothetical protein
MKGSLISILFVATLLTACGGGGGSSTPGGNNNSFSSITISSSIATSSSISSSSVAAVVPANINIALGAQKFTVTWNQVVGENYNAYIFDSPSCTPAAYAECPNAIKTNSVSSPYIPAALENKKNYWVYLEAVRGTNTASSSAHFVRLDNKVFDGAVNSIQVDRDGTTYLGGDFARYGSPIGHGYVADVTSGMPQKFPFIHGLVRASVADGKGGWYVGGDFLYVEGQQRTYLAHILPNGELDSWSPVLNGVVTALTFENDILYVGGVFTKVDNQERGSLASFTNGVLTGWAPQTSGTINSIKLFNNKIYIAGYFASINGLPRAKLAAIDKNGVPDNWMPMLDGVARTLVSTNDILYVGGSFTEINNQARTALAAFDKSGSLTDWKPDVLSNDSTGADVSAMLEHNSLIYIGGIFDSVNGLLRRNLATLDAANKVAAWQPEVLKTGRIGALAVSGNKIYVGGAQLALHNNKFYDLVATDANGAISYLPINFSHRVYTLTAESDEIFLGGELGLQDAQSRSHLASLDKDGNLTPWSPFTSGYIYSLVLGDDRVYVSGAFDNVSAVRSLGLAAITKGQTGNPIPGATPDVTGFPVALALSDKKLYIAGSFGSPGLGEGVSLAAIDLGTGKFLDWKPSINGPVVNSLAATNERVYVGGQFQSVDGKSRFNVASFDASGALEPWSPMTDGFVSGITPYQQTVYLRGGFQVVNGEAQSGIAALGLDGNLKPFESKSSVASRITILNDKIYYGSYYDTGSEMIGVQILRVSLNGKTDDWSIKLGANSYVNALTNDGTSLYIGGFFTNSNGKYTGPFLKVSP